MVKTAWTVNRIVYLETVHSLSAEACMGAIDSIVARRGMPLEMHSDNATCFVWAAKDYVGPTGSKLVWCFIPPRCPSMGGAWERHGLALVERLLNARSLIVFCLVTFGINLSNVSFAYISVQVVLR